MTRKPWATLMSTDDSLLNVVDAVGLRVVTVRIGECAAILGAP